MNIEKLFSQEPKIIRRNSTESDKLFLQNQKVEKRRRTKGDEPKIIRRSESKIDKSGEPESPSRRKFLKMAGAAAVVFGTGIDLKEIFEDEKEPSSAKASADAETMANKPAGEAKNGVEANKKETMEINNLADHYLKAYLEISKDPEKFPKEIFENDLLIAQQCQESRGEVDAESHSGALGVMQNMASSIIDVTDYLNKLKRNTGFEWSGPKKLSDGDMEKINKLITQKGDYGRAFGKIYLMQLWDNKYGYSVGRKKFEEGDVAGAQIELMGAYNAGLGRVKGKSLSEWKKLREKYRCKKDTKSQKEFRAYDEVITYVEKIFNYKKRIGNIREAIKKEVVMFDNNEDYAARELCLKLDAISNKEEWLKKYLAKFKNINLANKKKVSYRDIDIILES